MILLSPGIARRWESDFRIFDWGPKSPHVLMRTHPVSQIALDPLWKSLNECLVEAMYYTGLNPPEQGQAEGSQTGAASSAASAAPSSSSSPRSPTKASNMASLSSIGLVNRFLPMVEAFFVVNAREAKSIELDSERAHVRSTLDAPVVDVVASSPAAKR